MFTIREARPEDDARIGEILVNAFVTAYAQKAPELDVPEWRRAELRDVASRRGPALILVGELGGEIMGTVALFRPGAPGSEAWLEGFADLRHLAVDPALHGKGMSGPLLDEAIRMAREDWKCKGVTIHIRRGASGLVGFYSERGFSRDPSGDLIRQQNVFLEAYTLRFDHRA